MMYVGLRRHSMARSTLAEQQRLLLLQDQPRVHCRHQQQQLLELAMALEMELELEIGLAWNRCGVLGMLALLVPQMPTPEGG